MRLSIATLMLVLSACDALGGGEGCASPCRAPTPFCDAERHACVACRSDTDCRSASAPRCNAGRCTSCTSSAQCERFPATPACYPQRGCVQCTSEEADACAGNACTSSFTCSAYRMNRRVCERCDTDLNCMEADTYCVPMRNAGADRPGGYCLKATSAGCERPFSVATPARTTLSGVSGRTFCGINETLATCEAVRALIDDRPCPGGADAECPPGGVCSNVGVLTNRCTYRCAFATDCLPAPSPASSCGLASAMRNYCGG